MIDGVNIPFGKTFKPSLEEFEDFEQFMENCDKDRSLKDTGIFKVVGPKGWKSRKLPVEEKFEHLSVISPIEQNTQGKAGVYELLLIPKKSMKINEYRKKVESNDQITENKTIEEVEEKFLKSLAFSPPLYGADMPGNLFDENTTWNLKDLPGVLKEGLGGTMVSGVNNPYLYVGSWKTMFGWHKEDMDLYSINYLHYGKPKFWYCLAPSEQKKLEDFTRQYFPEGFGKCKEFMRHKTVMINPYLLKQKIPDLKIHKMIQYPGEFVITFGGGYHAGFNWGFNLAEAVNFATTRWLEILPTVGACKCISDSVKIDKEEFFKNIMNHPVYGKNPTIKKLCAEVAKEFDEENLAEDVGSEDTDDTKPNKSASKSKKQKNADLNEETKTSDKKVKKTNSPTKSKKTNKKKDGSASGQKEEEENEENDSEETDAVAPRISSRTKKIKKIGDEFEADVKLNARPRPTNTGNNKKVEKKPATKKNKIENWIQCDSCDKWRLVKDDNLMKKLQARKKVACGNIPGRSCDDDDDHSAQQGSKLVAE